jgi:uncharacterized protein (DUF488 family)
MKVQETPTLYTVGHSNRSLDEFISVLREHDIERVIDVRKLPGSTKYPHFNEEVLRDSLQHAGVELRRAEPLTGRRLVSKTVPFETNGWWQHRSFHNYADHALSSEFREAIIALIEAAATRRITVMCAEAVWWRCHRRIIADYLLAADCDVVHILGVGQHAAATLSDGAKVAPSVDGALAEITYPQQ